MIVTGGVCLGHRGDRTRTRGPDQADILALSPCQVAYRLAGGNRSGGKSEADRFSSLGP